MGRCRSDALACRAARRDRGRLETSQRRAAPGTRVRSLQTKVNLILAIGGHFLEVAVPGLAPIEAKLLGRPARQQVPRAFDVVGGKRFAVVPSDATVQRQGK